MKKYTAKFGQTIYDICLMTYGDLKYLFKLMQENNIVSLNVRNLSGKEFIFNPENIDDVNLYNYVQTKVINTQGKDDRGFLLQENGFYLLQENGFRILL